jgi:hypothetical protein
MAEGTPIRCLGISQLLPHIAHGLLDICEPRLKHLKHLTKFGLPLVVDEHVKNMVVVKETARDMKEMKI